LAKFNPDIQVTGDPNYLGLSKGIAQPEPDKSLSTLFSGIGNLLNAGVNAADAVIKQDIKDKVFTAVDTERNAVTTALEYTSDRMPNVTNTGGALGEPDEESSLDPMNAYAQATSDTVVDYDRLPTALQQLPQRLEALQGGYEKGMPYTMYYGNLTRIAKDLRAQYPGYREFIDRQINGILGTDPANAYIRAMSAQINAALAGSKNKKDDTLKLFDTQDALKIPNSQDMRQKYVNGEVSAYEARKWLNEKKEWQYRSERRKDDLDDFKGSRDKAKILAGEFVDTDMKEAVGMYFDNTLRLSGKYSAKNIEDLAYQISSGKLKGLSDDDHRALLTQLAASRKQAFDAKMREYTQVRQDSDGRNYSVASRLGGWDETAKRVNAGLASFDNIIEMFTNKDYGLAGSNARTVIDIQNTAKANILRDKDMGAHIANQKAIEELAGPTAAGKFFQTLTSMNLDEKFKTYTAMTLTEAAAQAKRGDVRTGQFIQDTLFPRPPAAPTGTNAPAQPAPKPPVTLNSMFNDAREKKIDDGAVYDTFIKITTGQLADPSVPADAKVAWAIAAFSPQNRNYLAQFAREYKDENGNIVPGKYSVWSRLTSPAVSNQMAKLAQQYADLGPMHANWAKEEFAVQLFGPELKELSNLRMDKRIAIGYNSDNQTFIVRRSNQPAGKYTTYAGDINQLEDYAKDVLGRLNNGLQGLSNVAKAYGRDPNDFLLDILVKNGFDPNKKEEPLYPYPDKSADPASAVNELGRALLNSKPPKGGSQNASQSQNKGRTEGISGGTGSGIAHFAPETKTPTLEQWLNNPTGEVTPRAYVPGTNISDGEIISTDVQNVPPGMSFEEFDRLQKQEQRRREAR
jgi:hypothetical protein